MSREKHSLCVVWRVPHCKTKNMSFGVRIQRNIRARINKSIVTGGLVIILSFSLLSVTYIQTTSAASLTALSDTQSRIKKNTAANHTFLFTSTSAMSSGTIVVTLPSDYVTTGVVFGDIDLSYGASGTENDQTLAGTAGASTWGAAFGGTGNRTLTLTYPTSGGTAITAGWKIIIEIGTNATTGGTGTHQVVNPTTAGTYVISIATASDTGQVATAIVDDDQVVVSTTIDPYLTFAISQNTVSLTKSGGGNPDSSNTGFNNGTANTLAAATNATSGYTITYYGDTLTSGANTISAMGTKTTSSTGTEQFGINLKDNATPNTGTDPSGGSGAAASDYNTADQFRYITNTTTTLASASAASASTTYTVSYIVNVAATTEAGSYSTTITYIATGNF